MTALHVVASRPAPPAPKASGAEAIVVEVLGVRSSATFNARFQQLQKMRIPWPEKLGRGRRRDYDAADILRIVVAFDLLAIGLMPAGIAKLIDVGLWARVEEAVRTGTPLRVYLGGLEAYGGFRASVQDDEGPDYMPHAMIYPAFRSAQIADLLAEEA